MFAIAHRDHADSTDLRDRRHEYLLNRFSEQLNYLCGFCDNCKASITLEKASSHIRQ